MLAAYNFVVVNKKKRVRGHANRLELGLHSEKPVPPCCLFWWRLPAEPRIFITLEHLIKLGTEAVLDNRKANMRKQNM